MEYVPDDVRPKPRSRTCIEVIGVAIPKYETVRLSCAFAMRAAPGRTTGDEMMRRKPDSTGKVVLSTPLPGGANSTLTEVEAPGSSLKMRGVSVTSR
jgi:hypothetical protein